MKRLLPFALFLLAVLLTPTLVIAQWVGPPPIESIDLPAANSKEIFTGSLVDFTTAPQPKGNYDLTIDVTETIKGGLHGRIHLQTYGTYAREMLKWKRLGGSLLFAVPQDTHARDTTIIDLTDENLAVFTADLKLLRRQEDVLRVMRELVRKSPKVGKVDEYLRNVPTSQFDGKIPPPEARGGFSRIGQLETIALKVPVDERLERYGEKLTDSKAPGERVQGIGIIRLFNSTKNADRLKQLLSDPGWIWTMDSTTNRTLVYRLNPVREAAFEALEAMGIHRERPVTEDPATPDERIVSVDLDDRGVSPADIDELVRYSKLVDLSLSGDKLDTGTLDSLSHLKPLKMLYLQSTDLTDDGLARLADLPNLAYMNLANTKVTGAGLAVLAKFKALRRVDIGLGESDRGVAELRRLRPDLGVQVDEFAFLRALKPRRVEMGFRGRTVHADQGLSPEVWRYGLIFAADKAEKVDALLRKHLPDLGWKSGIPGPDSEAIGFHRERGPLPPPNPGTHRELVYLPPPGPNGYEELWGTESPPGGRLIVIERGTAYRN